jgi:hypothetical protein
MQFLQRAEQLAAIRHAEVGAHSEGSLAHGVAWSCIHTRSSRTYTEMSPLCAQRLQEAERARVLGKLTRAHGAEVRPDSSLTGRL